MRYSLRTLAVCVTLFAAALGTWLNYRRATMCRLEWLKPGTLRNVPEVPEPKITQREHSVRVSYRSQYCDCRDLTTHYDHSSTTDSIMLYVPNVEAARNVIAQFKAFDVRPPNLCSIRGRIVDRRGNPLVSADVELSGSVQRMFRQHADQEGYFKIRFRLASVSHPPRGNVYRIRVSDYDAPLPRWESASFAFDPATPEQEVIVHVPTDLEQDTAATASSRKTGANE